MAEMTRAMDPLEERDRRRVAEIIRELRLRRMAGATRAELARQLGVGENEVSRWESPGNNRVPYANTFLRILDLAGIDLLAEGPAASEADRKLIMSLAARLRSVEEMLAEGERPVYPPIDRDPEEYVTARAAQRLPGAPSHETIRKAVAAGEMPAWRRGKATVVLLEDMKRWIAAWVAERADGNSPAREEIHRRIGLSRVRILPNAGKRERGGEETDEGRRDSSRATPLGESDKRPGQR